MSNSVTTIDAAGELAAWTRRLSGMYAKDLKALSQEAYEKPLGEKTRTVHEITAEVSGFNFAVASMIDGTFDGLPTDAQREAHKNSVATVGSGVNAILKSGDVLAHAIESGGTRLGDKTTAPWGEEMTLYQLANLTANHILYHDGQVNFVQSLHGDDKMHWFDE